MRLSLSQRVAIFEVLMCGVPLDSEEGAVLAEFAVRDLERIEEILKDEEKKKELVA